MRITYRSQNNKEYWSKRWADIPIDKPMENIDAYPLKYSEKIISSKEGKILEAGCGAGRLLRYYHDRGYDIIGMDFIEGVIKKLKDFDSSLQVEVGDITALKFPDATFKYILAFGLYHNLENGLQKAMQETYRVMLPGGKLCASFRADNFQTRLSDFIEKWRGKSFFENKKNLEFHKINLKRSECLDLFQTAGFVVENVFTAENMPLLYKFSFFRHSTHRIFDENKARKEGYRLSGLGKLITQFIMKFFPDQFCNIYVITAVKPL